MRLKEIMVYRGRLDLFKVFRISYGEWSSVDTVFIKTVLEDGSVGWGEAPPAPEITGDTVGTVVESIRYVSDHLRSFDVEDLRGLNALLRRKLRNNSAAVGGLINSILDALAKSRGVPLARILGGSIENTEVVTDVTVGLDSPEEMAKEALRWVEKGFRTLKVKLGGGDGLDVERVKAIRDVVGSKVRIRVDANQAWSPKEAVRIGRSLERLEVEMIEQPVKADDLLGLRHVRNSLEIPIVADESVHDSNDLKHLITLEAVDGINIKLSKCGGLVEALKMVDIATTFGLELMVGCMIESALGIAFASHLVAATGAFTYVDLDADLDLKSQPIRKGLRRENDKILLDPGLSGVGVEPDEEKLEEVLRFELR